MSTETVLMDYLRGHSPLVVLFSGGVDSSVLCALAMRAGADVVALTVDNGMLSAAQREQARAGACELGVEHEVVEVDMLSTPVALNTSERCYLCKRAMILAASKVYLDWNIAEGTNTSEVAQPRAGMRAVRELGVLSPYLELNIGKAEIRQMAERMGLSCHGLPSDACLATRIPSGERITKDKLERVDRAELALRKLGFSQVRVRAHGELARLEVGGDEVGQACEMRGTIVQRIRTAGFSRVCLDLEGYKGSD